MHRITSAVALAPDPAALLAALFAVSTALPLAGAIGPSPDAAAPIRLAHPTAVADAPPVVAPTRPRTTTSPDTRRAAAPRIVMDGHVEDWTDVPGVGDLDPLQPDGFAELVDLKMTADDRFVHVLVTFDRPVTLQGMPGPLMLRLSGMPSRGLGRGDDVLAATNESYVYFSPIDQEDGRVRRGTSVRGHDNSTDRPADTFGVIALPTHGARTFEVRVDRATLRRGDDRYRLWAELFDAGGAPIDRTPIAEAIAPSRTVAKRDPVRFELRQSRRSDLRLVSWNAERGAIMRDSAPFAATFNALEPDVVLLQELDDGTTPLGLSTWFDRALARDRAQWTAIVASAQLPTAVVSSSPLTRPEELARIEREDPRGRERSVRVASGVVEHDGRRILVASLHLKCCGGLGTSEDETRRAEVEAIREAIRLATARIRPDAIVIGGDLNLVGTRTVLSRLAEGLAPNGGDLVVVESMRPHGDDATSWERGGASFVPGRLDWLLVGGATVDRSFIVDPRAIAGRQARAMLSPATGDLPSDHLPIVVDLTFSERP